MYALCIRWVHVHLCITTDNHRRKENVYQGIFCMGKILHVDCSAATHAKKGPIVTSANIYMGEGDVSLITTVSDLL